MLLNLNFSYVNKIAAVAIVVCCSVSAQATKMVFVGNSITDTEKLEDLNCGGKVYRELLMERLTADGWEIQSRTMAKSGFALVQKIPGASPFHCDNESNSEECLYREFKPDIIIEMLGTNDAHLKTDYPYSEWVSDSVFAQELRRLVDTFTIAGDNPEVYLCLPPPLWDFGKGAQNLYRDTLLTKHINPVKRMVARERSLKIIDMHTPLEDKPGLFPDGVHPDCDGHVIMAETAYGVITSQTVGAIAGGVRKNYKSRKTRRENSLRKLPCDNLITLYDFQGNRLNAQHDQSNLTDLKRLPKGIYLIKTGNAVIRWIRDFN
ncbi:MAG: hypothetical protein GF401_00430 [Chitinivibrionales bacterium]|nr:hypothetical protein [Chitinivibrionales bacterium]